MFQAYTKNLTIQYEKHKDLYQLTCNGHVESISEKLFNYLFSDKPQETEEPNVKETASKEAEGVHSKFGYRARTSG